MTQSLKRHRKNPETRGRGLACPFFKRNLQRHIECLNFKATKISHVKQHLYRKHKPIYCPCCMATFQDEHSRDLHSRERSCQSQPLREPDSITNLQEEQLRRRPHRSSPQRTEEEQWFGVFEIVFPGCPLPSSAYNDLELPEEVPDLQSFISNHGSEILLQALESHPSWRPDDTATFRDTLGSGLANLIPAWSAQRYSATNNDVAADTGGPVQTVGAWEGSTFPPSFAITLRPVDTPQPRAAAHCQRSMGSKHALDESLFSSTDQQSSF